MAEHIGSYRNVLEVGCGTGHSTKALVEAGHNVVALENNEDCANRARELMASEIEAKRVVIVSGDITDDKTCEYLMGFNIDIVICWNVGSYWSDEMIEDYYPKMLRFGLTERDISANLMSSYIELINGRACIISKVMQIPIHFIDRGSVEFHEDDDTYYCALKEECGFDRITYDNLEGKAKSTGGRRVMVNGVEQKGNEIDVYYISILLER